MVIPTTIGRYRVEARLAEGGMGIVYVAVAPDGERVALKVLRTALSSEVLRRRFAREAAHHVDHPNVVRVVEAGADAEGAPFIAFELLCGETMAERFARARPEIVDLVSWCIGACGGLAAAHRQRIVHRDVKPSNLFLCGDGSVKVIDFGIALLDDGRTRLTDVGAVPGTVGYLSPEQAGGQLAIDARSDVWSLGAVLYEGLTGAPPFRQPTPLATVVATLMAELVPIRVHNPNVPPELARVVERALARDRDHRYASADDLARALAVERESGAATTLLSRPASIRPGERRVVALLFAEGLREPDVLAEAVGKEGGALLRLVGDRALGVFGLERWDGDEVERAARAALASRDAADRASVCAGWVTGAGASIAGDALDAAERCSAAGLAGVALDTEAARVLRDSREVVRIADGLFELRGDGAIRDSDTIPIVDRHSELAQLRAALRTVVVDRRALIASVIGPPGMGKTRLRTELEGLIKSEVPSARIATAAATPRSQEADLALVRDIVRSVGDVTAEALSKLGVRDAHRHARALAELLSFDVRPAASVDFATARDRVRLAFLELFSTLAERPLAILIEDLHWSDEASLELLEDLIDHAADAPLLLAVTARTELELREPKPFAGRDVVLVEPRPFTRDDVATLAERVAGRALPEPLVGALAERTGGNPFFVVQSVRALADEDALDMEDPAQLTLPATVEAAVQSRLDHLPHDERELCRRASVWGRPFTVDEARALGVSDPEALLESLLRRDLAAARGRRRGVYQLKSALVAEVAYRTLTDPRKRELHAAAAAHLASRTGSDPEERARHYELAGDAVRSCEQYGLAARAAVRRGDTRSALRCAERALALGAPADARFALHSVRIDALRFLGPKEQGMALVDALESARTDAERARALSERAVWLLRAGSSAEALACVGEAVEAACASSDRDALVLSRGRQFLVLNQLGRTEEAEAALTEAVALAAEADPALRATALAWRAHHLASRGDLAARLHAFLELAEAYEELGDVRRAAGARSNLADAYNRLGAYAEAAEALESALEDCRRVGNRTMEGFTLLNLAYARIGLGALEAALADLERAAAIAQSTSEARLLGIVRSYRARALLAAGRHADARSEADEASAEAPPDLQVGALAIGARACVRMGDLDGALERSERALSIYDALGGIEEDEADVFVARAEALEHAGRGEEAEAIRARGRARVAAIAAAIGDAAMRERFLSANAVLRDRSAR